MEVAAARPWGVWRNLSKAASLPQSCQGEGPSEQSDISPALGCHRASFSMVFSTCFESETSHPIDIYPV